MSTLYLGSDPRSLADRLADDLERQAKHGDFFVPSLIVVPNRYLRKWLRLWLARRLDVAIHLDFQSLEDALWSMLRQVEPNQSGSPAEAIGDDVQRLMVLSVLLEEDDAHLAPLRRYLQLNGPTLTRLSCRRAWFLAERLALSLRDYEYHRQGPLIQRWLARQFALGEASDLQKAMERGQRSLFLHMAREPDGKRAVLNRLSGKTFKTFPQYAMESMARPNRIGPTGRVVHFFGFTHISELHLNTIRWLGQFFDVRFHCPNVLAGRVMKDDGNDPGRELLDNWCRAGAEALSLTTRLLDPSDFQREVIQPIEPTRRSGSRAARKAADGRSTSVLTRLHDHLLAVSTSQTRLDQDTSVQIVGCPGISREVETVHNSILHNLQNDSSLRQTDIAVLVTDMSKYRPTLEAVFESPPRHLQFNMVDYSAAGISMLGQALLGMLDLALESFSRSRVFQVILNPCFLARLGVDRGQAMVWLEWAENLGICQGWDAEEKEQQGYPRSPFFAWRLGLQRLRLGRFMDVGRDDAAEPAPRFGHVIPFADLASSDREQLDAFCEAVEGLLPELARLRSTHAGGQRWANVLARLVQDFLDVPADRPEEAQVRDDLLAGLEHLARWDALHDSVRRPGLPLALVREYVQSQLEVLQGNRGEYLTGGVTIAALQPMRPVPFQIIYVVGLGEDLFPGSNALSSFDLRAAQRLPGDIRPAEHRLYDFLTTVLAAQQRLYLLYNSHDLQKDQPLQPAAVLQQLQRYLSRHALKGEFQPVAMPFFGDDARYLEPSQQPPHQDVLVQYRDAERCLALAAAERENRLALDLAQRSEWLEKRQEFHKDFSVPPKPAGDEGVRGIPPATVSLNELRRFLIFPAQASLRRHLYVEDDDERTLDDEEPLVTPESAAHALVRQTIQQLVLSAVKTNVQQSLASWKDRFAQTYADSRLRCLVPEEAFGDIDRASLERELEERIHGQGQIEQFLKYHSGMTYCGPVLIGESPTPLGARLRFPALRLRPGHELSAESPREIRLTGWTQYAWHSPGRFDILIVTNFKDIDGGFVTTPLIEPALMHLAMLAGVEPNADGMSAQQWLAGREVLLHVAHGSGIQTWPYAVNSITPAEAMQYLVELTRDFLDPTQFDLLPFDVLSRNLRLRNAYNGSVEFQISPEDFRQGLQELIADAREYARGPGRIPLLVDMVRAQVPADALAKVQRRFRLLDRGPARVRHQPRVYNRKRSPEPPPR